MRDGLNRGEAFPMEQLTTTGPVRAKSRRQRTAAEILNQPDATVSAVARVYGESRKTVLKRLATGKIEHYVEGGRHRVKLDSYQRYRDGLVEEQRATPIKLKGGNPKRAAACAAAPAPAPAIAERSTARPRRSPGGGRRT